MSQNTVKDARTWRDSKMPEWVKDSVRQELIQAALRWPSEPKPKPLPFGFGSHDSMVGSVQPGVYWHTQGGYPTKFAIRLRDENEVPAHRHYRLKELLGDTRPWNFNYLRGPWFRTEKEARLFILWEKCEEFSKMLFSLSEKVRTASDEVPNDT